MTFRTLDVGGDKIAASSTNVPEDNPALGWRSILPYVGSAGLAATAVAPVDPCGRGTGIARYFPMIAAVAEFDAARRLFDMEMERHVGRDVIRRPALR